MRAVSVPMVVGRTEFGERALDIYSRLLEERIVLVGRAVDDDVANTVIAQLLYLEATDPDKDISMYINSPGGSAYAGLAIYDTMQHISCEVATVGMGTAASAAALLLCGGAPGRRAALPNCKIMIHQGSAGFQGAPADIEIHAREVLDMTQRAVAVIAHHTGRSIEQVRADIDRDLFMAPNEARAYGLIDRVMPARGGLSLGTFVPELADGEDGNGRTA